jgi:hypothetical protein
LLIFRKKVQRVLILQKHQKTLTYLQPARPKTHVLGYKQREEEDFPYPTFLYFFNQQTIQALKAKNNPNQTIKNANQATEEEDLPFRTPFFLQTANNPTPKQQKQPKPNFSKCNCNPSSSITQQKNPHISLYKHPTLTTNNPPSNAQNSSTLTLPHIAQISKKQTYRLNQSKGKNQLRTCLNN